MKYSLTMPAPLLKMKVAVGVFYGERVCYLYHLGEQRRVTRRELGHVRIVGGFGDHEKVHRKPAARCLETQSLCSVSASFDGIPARHDLAEHGLFCHTPCLQAGLRKLCNNVPMRANIAAIARSNLLRHH